MEVPEDDLDPVVSRSHFYPGSVRHARPFARPTGTCAEQSSAGLCLSALDEARERLQMEAAPLYAEEEREAMGGRGTKRSPNHSNPPMFRFTIRDVL